MEQRISVGEKAHHHKGGGFFKSEARHCMMRGDNLAKLIFAFLTLGIFAAFFVYILDAVNTLSYYGIFSLSARSYDILLDALGYIVILIGTYTVFALMCGYWVMCIDMYGTGRGKLGKLFYIFESGTRMRACLAGYILTALCSTPGVALFVFVYGADIYDRTLRHIALFSAAFLGAMIFFVLLFFMLAYPLCQGQGISKRLKKSARVMKNHIFSLIVLTLSFIPLIIISVLSFGILFIIYTVPYISLSLAAAVSWAVDVDKYGMSGGEYGKQG